MLTSTELEQKCKDIRRKTLEYVVKAGKGHLGGSFSCVEILVALYYGGILRHDPTNPDWPERDRFILSKGHACNTLYTILADLGYFPESELDRYTQNGALLGGHSDWRIPGVEVISGSLGHGLGIAAGRAWAAKMNGKDYRVFCLLGDGECMEGSVWEAAREANWLSNLVIVVDYNRLMSEDRITWVSPDDFAEIWRSFGWFVTTWHLKGMSSEFVHERGARCNRPECLIVVTTKGKGLPYADTPRSHHTMPTEEELEEARRMLA